MYQKLKVIENDNLIIDSIRLDYITPKQMYSELDSEGLKASSVLPGGFFELDSLVYYISSMKRVQLLDKKKVTLVCLGTVEEVLKKLNVKLTEEQEIFWDKIDNKYKN